MQRVMDISIVIVLCAAVVLDFRTYRIPNVLVLPMMAAGLAFHFFEAGMVGFFDALAGCLLPFGLLFILYAFSMLGAGDIKLLMAAGAVTGFRGSGYSILIAFFIGAVFSILRMIKNRNFLVRLKFLVRYLFRMVSKIHFSLEPYYDLKTPHKEETLHFSLSIALGVCSYLLFLR